MSNILVAAVSLLIAFLHLSSQLFVLLPWMECSVNNALRLLIFNLLTAMVYQSYYLACATDPGRVPSDYSKTIPGLVENKLVNRYCRKCDNFKPPRTHHCSTCKMCTLKMDHHCPWINNCVGYGNHASFYRFLAWVVLACGWLFYLLCLRTADLFITLASYEYARYSLGLTSIAPVSSFEIVMLILNLVADIFVLLPVGILCAYQTYYIASNTTTIESWEKDRVQSMTRQKLISAVPFPYDLGPMRNFRSVLGQNILLWLWPGSVRPIADGKGLRFDTIENFSGVWPPVENNTRFSVTAESDYSSDGTDDEDYDEDQVPLEKYIPRIRRGSEGYEVKLMPVEEREQTLHSIDNNSDDDNSVNCGRSKRNTRKTSKSPLRPR